MTGIAPDRPWDRDRVQTLIDEIIAAPTEDFVRLLAIARLDPARDLRFCDWSGVDFANSDLRRFDFTGANLLGCRFDGAHIAGARFEGAQVDRTALRRAADWAEHLRSWRAPLPPPGDRHLPELVPFSDAPFAPEMVALPLGEFQMGSPESDKEGYSNERPQHRVTIGYRSAIGRYPVTVDEHDHFYAATKREKPADQRWGRGRRPVINVSWEDAQAYVAWLAEVTGKLYRLPSEAEWEYAARAGTTTRYAFGNEITEKEANFGGDVGKTTKVGAYPANPWGLHDMHGNVREWVEDVWHDSYQGAPADGSAWTDSEGKVSSRNRVLRGGSWDDYPWVLRSAYRSGGNPGGRYIDRGFRVARTLD